MNLFNAIGFIGGVVTLISFICILMIFVIDVKSEKIRNIVFIFLFIGCGLIGVAMFPDLLVLVNRYN